MLAVINSTLTACEHIKDQLTWIGADERGAERPGRVQRALPGHEAGGVRHAHDHGVQAPAAGGDGRHPGKMEYLNKIRIKIQKSRNC